MSSRITCLLSGKSFLFTKVYFEKRAAEYGDATTLLKYYVTKKVKSLIIRGYDVNEIRNILDIRNTDVLPADSQEVKDVINYHKLQDTKLQKKKTYGFSEDKSDDVVSIFINNIKNLNYD